MRPPTPATATPATATALLAAALVLAAGWAGGGTALAAASSRSVPAGPPASTAACYSFAVAALRQHVIVRRMPPACAGLPPEQVNEAVGRAIRTVVGPLPKAAARRAAIADSRYLASLIRPVRPPRAAALPGTATAAPSSSLPARLGGLVAWLAAAIAGGYLLSRRLARTGRRITVEGTSAWVAGSHAGLAVTGLLIWVPFVVTAQPVLGWLDAALTWVIVGLGMATLLAGLAGPPDVTRGLAVFAPDTAEVAAAFPARAPVLVIALHGVLATAVVVLVLLAVVGVG